MNQFTAYLDVTEKALKDYCDVFFDDQSMVGQAARYSLLNAGKRVRAILIYLTAEMCHQDWHHYINFACAIEMIHCYSLIHDDLPCMDDDDMRRGKPSCHKAYGEDVALLAGDALLGCSVEVIANNTMFSASTTLLAIKQVCAAMGPKGMIWGQELDLKYENLKASKEVLNRIHRNKTGKLISLSGQLGSLESGLTPQQSLAIETFFQNIGLVFQIVDDILDVEGDAEELGKPLGSDQQNCKSTFITLYGLEDSKLQVANLTNQANEMLRQAFGEDSLPLIQYADSLAKRKK